MPDLTPAARGEGERGRPAARGEDDAGAPTARASARARRGAGGRLSSVRLQPGAALRRARLGAQHLGRGRDPGRGRGRRAWRRFARLCRAKRRHAPSSPRSTTNRPRPRARPAFAILESAAEPAAYQLVSPDIATCDDCRRELLDPADRRYRYPFINCTNCGPRFTIIDDAALRPPSARPCAAFPMCPACRREYDGPRRPALPRRAQRLPGLRAAGDPDRRAPGAGRRRGATGRGAGRRATAGAAGAAGVVLARRRRRARSPGRPELLCGGAIMAVKGLGGFHLACDATDEAAVRRLKERKRRPHKPLAVMFGDLEQLAAHCRLTAAERGAADLGRAPIVLVEWRQRGGLARRARARPRRPRRPRRPARSAPRSRCGSATSASCCPTRRCTSCCSRPPAGRW